MLRFLHSRNTCLLGIDISSAAVKLLELSRLGQRYRVESYAVIPLPPGAVSEKNIKDKDAVGQALEKTIKSANTRLKYASVAVPDSFVITKVIQMDKELRDEDIESQILFEADKYIPYPLEEVSLDFQIIGPCAKNTETVDVLLVASRSENVNTRINVVKSAGLQVKIVDVDSYAVERACRMLADVLPNRGVDQTIAVIDIGATMTNLTVLYNLATVFTREEVFGGMRLTEDIMRHYGLTYEEAGIAKKQNNMPDDYATEVLAPFKEAAIVQVRRALQFFFSASQHNKIDHIVLAGGTVGIPGLDQLIQEQLGVPTTVANPFADMVISNNVNAQALIKDAPALMISCGLALRSFTDGAHQ